ncbi:MAG: MFS transporter [Victivallales bacterium]|nr:MFS transporter [Victivallales bacterium]
MSKDKVRGFSLLGRVLFLSYITSFFAGYAFPLAGILSPQIAAALNVDVSHIVFVDAFFLIGLTSGSILSGKIIVRCGSVKTIVSATITLFFVNIGFSLQYLIFIYAFLVFMNGIAMGVLIAAVNYFIILYFSGVNNNQSDSKLNIMQFFVGFGCFIGAGTAGLIVVNLSWRCVFGIVAVLYLFILICFKLVKVPSSSGNLTEETENRNVSSEKRIPLYILMIGIAMIAYVYTEYVISYWFSPYLQQERGFCIEKVGYAISVFWITLAFGRLFLGKFVIPKVSDFYFIILLAFITVLGFVIFINSYSLLMIFVSIIILGIGCSAIFPTLLAYGMKLSDGISAYILSFLVMCGFLGGFLSLICSAFLGANFPKAVPVLTGPLWTGLIILFLFLGSILKDKSKN